MYQKSDILFAIILFVIFWNQNNDDMKNATSSVDKKYQRYKKLAQQDILKCHQIFRRKDVLTTLKSIKAWNDQKWCIRQSLWLTTASSLLKFDICKTTNFTFDISNNTKFMSALAPFRIWRAYTEQMHIFCGIWQRIGLAKQMQQFKRSKITP